MKFTFSSHLDTCMLGFNTNCNFSAVLKKQVNYGALNYWNYKSFKEMLVDSLWSQQIKK